MVTNQFEKTEDHGRVAIKGVLAVWNDSSNESHVAIAAPTKEALASIWKKITGLELGPDTQRVLFLKGETDGR